MKVYVITTGEYSNYHIVAVFSSIEQYETWLQALPVTKVRVNNRASEWNDQWGLWFSYNLHEWDGHQGDITIGWYPTEEDADRAATDPSLRLGKFRIEEWDIDPQPAATPTP